MSNTNTTDTRTVLTMLGFQPDSCVVSDEMPGLSCDFGNFLLTASFVRGRPSGDLVLFAGFPKKHGSVRNVNFEIPRIGMPSELVTAWIVSRLDRAAAGGRFEPLRLTGWLQPGRQNRHLLPQKTRRPKQIDGAYAARPHCAVDRALLNLALKTLSSTFPDVGSAGSVVVSFDGRLLSFLCNGVNSAVVATGAAWPSRYRLTVEAVADALPIQLRNAKVGVGIWKSMLEIDRVRCPGVRALK